MSNEIANQLLVRVQNEMAQNINSVKKQLIEWLDRPESGGVDGFCDQLVEVNGSLILLGKKNAAQLCQAIEQSVKTLNNNLKSKSIDEEYFSKVGAEVAAGLLLLSDYIERLNQENISDSHDLFNVASAITTLVSGDGDTQIQAKPIIDKATYQALADNITQIIDTNRNQIEQYGVHGDKSFNANIIIENNNNIIGLFEILNLKAPQILLQHINEMLVSTRLLNETQWIDIAESFVLVEEALKSTELEIKVNASDFQEATTGQASRVRTTEVIQLLRNTGVAGRQIYEGLRKSITHNEKLEASADWAGAAIHSLNYSSVFYFANNASFGKLLRALSRVLAELSLHKEYKSEAYIPVVDALVGAEYLFNDLADTAQIRKNDAEFLKQAIEKILVVYPISKNADALLHSYINTKPQEEESVTGADNLSNVSLDSLLDDLDVLDNGLETASVEEMSTDNVEESEESTLELPKEIVVSLSSNNDATSVNGSVATTPITNFFAGKSLDEVSQLPVPQEKLSFTESHADAVMDDEIREFFLEELDEKLEEIKSALPVWQSSPNDNESITTVRRAFHTIKGSGRTVGYESLGECAWQHESILNRILDKTFKTNAVIQALISDTVGLCQLLRQGTHFIEHKGALLTQAYLAEQLITYLIAHPEANDNELYQVIADARRTLLGGASGAVSNAVTSMSDVAMPSITSASSFALASESSIHQDASTATTTAAPSIAAPVVEQSTFSDNSLDTLTDIEALSEEIPVSAVAASLSANDVAPETTDIVNSIANRFFTGKSISDLAEMPVPTSKIEIAETESDVQADAEIQSFFLEELDEKIQEIVDCLPKWQAAPNSNELALDIRRAFHTIKGSGRTVGYNVLGEFAWQHEHLLNGISEKHYSVNRVLQNVIADAADLLKILRSTHEFMEYKGALLCQATVAEILAKELTNNPNMSDEELSALEQQLQQLFFTGVSQSLTNVAEVPSIEAIKAASANVVNETINAINTDEITTQNINETSSSSVSTVGDAAKEIDDKSIEIGFNDTDEPLATEAGMVESEVSSVHLGFNDTDEPLEKRDDTEIPVVTVPDFGFDTSDKPLEQSEEVEILQEPAVNFGFNDTDEPLEKRDDTEIPVATVPDFGFDTSDKPLEQSEEVEILRESAVNFDFNDTDEPLEKRDDTEIPVVTVPEFGFDTSDKPLEELSTFVDTVAQSTELGFSETNESLASDAEKTTVTSEHIHAQFVDSLSETGNVAFDVNTDSNAQVTDSVSMAASVFDDTLSVGAADLTIEESSTQNGNSDSIEVAALKPENTKNVEFSDFDTVNAKVEDDLLEKKATVNVASSSDFDASSDDMVSTITSDVTSSSQFAAGEPAVENVASSTSLSASEMSDLVATVTRTIRQSMVDGQLDHSDAEVLSAVLNSTVSSKVPSLSEEIISGLAAQVSQHIGGVLNNNQISSLMSGDASVIDEAVKNNITSLETSSSTSSNEESSAIDTLHSITESHVAASSALSPAQMSDLVATVTRTIQQSMVDGQLDHNDAEVLSTVLSSTVASKAPSLSEEVISNLAAQVSQQIGGALNSSQVSGLMSGDASAITSTVSATPTITEESATALPASVVVQQITATPEQLRYQHMANLLQRSLQMQPIDSDDEAILANQFAHELQALGQNISNEAEKENVRLQLQSFIASHSDINATETLLSHVLDRLVAQNQAANNPEVQRLANMAKQLASDGDVDTVEADIFANQLQSSIVKNPSAAAFFKEADSHLLAALLANNPAAISLINQAVSKIKQSELGDDVADNTTINASISDLTDSIEVVEKPNLGNISDVLDIAESVSDASEPASSFSISNNELANSAMSAGAIESIVTEATVTSHAEEFANSAELESDLYTLSQDSDAVNTSSDMVSTIATDDVDVALEAQFASHVGGLTDQAGLESDLNTLSLSDDAVNISHDSTVSGVTADVANGTVKSITAEAHVGEFADHAKSERDLNTLPLDSDIENIAPDEVASSVTVGATHIDNTIQNNLATPHSPSLDSTDENGVDNLLDSLYGDASGEAKAASIEASNIATDITMPSDKAAAFADKIMAVGDDLAKVNAISSTSSVVTNDDLISTAEDAISVTAPVVRKVYGGSLSDSLKPSLSSAGRNSTERLSQELSQISAQHPSSDNVIDNMDESHVHSLEGFLRAVDHFDTLSKQVEHDNSPELIDSLIESVYDIEDTLNPENAPDWIWRMLDAIEQLLLTHRSQGASVPLSAASILRQSVNLIEHYSEDSNEDEVNQTISSLMSARQTIASTLPKNVSIPEVMPIATSDASITQHNWDEWIPDPNAGTELLETFLDEAVALLGRSQLEAERWDANKGQITHLDTIRRDMHTLKGSARMAGYMAIGDLTHAVESMIESIIDGHSPANTQAAAILNGAMWQGMIMLDSVRDGFLPQTDPYMLNNINRFLGLPLPYPEIAENEERIKAEAKAHPTTLPPVVSNNVEVSAESAVDVTADHEMAEPVPEFGGNAFDENIDPVLVDIFSDEAQELIEQAEVLLSDDLRKPEVIEELKRNMHTLKGGARLVGLTAIGDTSHLMESVIEQIPDYNDTKMRQAKTLLIMGHEALYGMLDSVLRQEMPTPSLSLNDSLEVFAKEGRFVQPSAAVPASEEPVTASHNLQAPVESDDSVSATVNERDEAVSAESNNTATPMTDADQPKVAEQPMVDKAIDNSSVIDAKVESTSAPEVKAEVPTEKPVSKVAEQASHKVAEKTAQAEAKTPETSEAKKADSDSIPSEVQRFVRVDASLLDEMIAMIGETAIMRSRMENISADSEFNLTELSRIATRIDEQMRRLDNETEAQMLFRRDAQETDDEHFDPLEMDRFSEIQQLSRQLMEAIDDLKNVRDTLAQENTLMRNLSNQQGIIQRGIQERLLTTQLIRFDSNEARLKRLVRQTAKSINKDINFVLEGGEVELERRLIEDILPAIEHMVRNSIGHGIELASERIAAGKPAQGTIKLAIEAKASNVEVRILDDGRGFDYDRIREKAREKGWLPAERENDIPFLNSLMMRSGFSTAKVVTQLSGRGVGMDVVNEMVKQRRGQITAESIPGKGAQFTISMPFSMSIAEVLLVDVAGQTYAAPMSSIAAINQISLEELKRAHNGEEIYHHYDGMDYRLYILGDYFKPQDYELLVEDVSVPALFVNAGGEPVALFVDRIANRLEIIVKNVNRQILSIPGISGATILGDGHVVPVLELLDLSRRLPSLNPVKDIDPVEQEPQTRNILVVDDSVTMRKVSTRLLERNGYVVETAKDGLDAIDVLTRYTPDLILLDIEMPRMDGFEFANHVRQNSLVKKVPIIMVTSRTGDKHRERAEEIGVQGYLGKPYREDILIETIESLLGEKAHG